MSHTDAFRNHNSSSRPSRPLPQHVVMNPFRGSPTSGTGATHPANGTSSIMGKHAARADGTVSRAKVSSISSSEATRSALPRMSATDTASSTNATTYTGAAILGSYTNRRKLLQKASALSSQMHRQVDDVVQMEEEQRLLSQAFRSRQKLQEQEQEQAQQQQRMATAKSGSPMQVSVLAEAAGDEEEAEDAATSHRDGDPLSSAARANTDSYGVVLDGTPDTKRLLQQQAHEKNEMLGKMRGMQLAIQELSAEAAADEERWFAHSRYHGAAATTTEAQSDNGGRSPATTNTDNNNNKNNRSSSGGNTTTEEPTVARSRGAAPPDVLSKLDAIRDLRTALKDMMDAHRPHAADRGSYGSSGSGVNGATWVELDAAYNPPAPPQVFSTNALAVTLEYVSDSMASIARIADEFCVATTFRARSDRLSLLPHLQSLKKWTAQAERSLDTTQRHLRHFQVGETAVLDGGAFEVNSLREQTLLLKESLTAQDQKVKSTEEARMAVLHRLREVRRRCRMWEVRLLHRASGVRDSNEAKLRETPVFYSLANARPNRSTASLSTNSSNVASPRKGNDDSAQETDVPRTDDDHGGVDANGATNKSGRPASSTFLLQASTDGVETRAAAAESGRQRSAMANDASPPPRLPQPATIILKDFLQPSYAQTQASLMQTTTFSATRSGGPPSSSAMDRMERRIAQSWGNPYVRKQLMRQRAEQAAAAEQQQQQHAATGQEMTSFGSLPQHGVQIGGVPTLPITPSPYQGEFKVQRNAHTNGAGQNVLRSPTENGYVAFGSATTNPIQFTPSQPRLARSLSPTTPSMAGLGGGQATSPHASHGDAQRRSRVSVYHPGHHSTMTLNETSERSRGSRVFGSTATVASANSALGEGEIAELADVRTLQLLQSLLRTFPAHTSSSKHSHGTHEAEAPLGVADVMQDDLIRETTRHSVQRLVQFLKAQTQEQQNLSRPSLSQKQ